MAARSCCALCVRRASLPMPKPPCSPNLPFLQSVIEVLLWLSCVRSLALSLCRARVPSCARQQPHARISLMFSPCACEISLLADAWSVIYCAVLFPCANSRAGRVLLLLVSTPSRIARH
jgi:hypothetical protein